ncbi:MAG: hypothetical protein ACRD0J_12525 [Acidimicrobiales bacterium]
MLTDETLRSAWDAQAPGTIVFMPLRPSLRSMILDIGGTEQVFVPAGPSGAAAPEDVQALIEEAADLGVDRAGVERLTAELVGRGDLDDLSAIELARLFDAVTGLRVLGSADRRPSDLARPALGSFKPAGPVPQAEDQPGPDPTTDLDQISPVPTTSPDPDDEMDEEVLGPEEEGTRGALTVLSSPDLTVDPDEVGLDPDDEMVERDPETGERLLTLEELITLFGTPAEGRYVPPPPSPGGLGLGANQGGVCDCPAQVGGETICPHCRGAYPAWPEPTEIIDVPWLGDEVLPEDASPSTWDGPAGG